MQHTKLFCFPYAGGSASMYHPFKSRIKKNIELYPIELAGKGSRMNESFNNNFDELINDAVNGILSNGDLDSFALFGYSLGGLIAYEVALKLYFKYKLKPKIIFYAACPPTHIPSEHRYMYEQNDHTFIHELMKLGGMAPEIINDPEMLELFLPILRADFKMIKEYDYTKRMPQLPVDIVALYSDEENKDGRIWEWERSTSNTCEFIRFQGGHFFINQHYEEIIEIINSKLS